MRHRDELLEAQRELAEIEGVTVLIHDQECAAELRRRASAARRPSPPQRIWINERVCEGCGDCGEEVELPVRPAGGDRVRPQDADPPGLLQQGLLVRRGRLPVVPHRGARRSAERRSGARSRRRTCPSRCCVVRDADCGVRMMGIGGTGVVTVSQVLGMAALIDGLHVRGLDQTGLAQKGGPVVSDLRISRAALGVCQQGAGRQRRRLPRLRPARRRRRPNNLASADPARTVARRVHQRGARPAAWCWTRASASPSSRRQLDRIDAVTRSDANLYLDAQALSERLFGDHMTANTLALGAAYQRGLLPVSAAALEQAIRLNGAAVEKNLAAFRWGRAVVVRPDAVESATAVPEPPAPELSESSVSWRTWRWMATASVRTRPSRVRRLRGELRRLVEIRVPELIGYQSEAYARRYAEAVRRVQVAEQEPRPGTASSPRRSPATSTS